MKTTDFLNLSPDTDLLLHSPLGILRVSTKDTKMTWRTATGLKHVIPLQLLEPGKFRTKKYVLNIIKQGTKYEIEYDDFLSLSFSVPISHVEIMGVD